jgi:hypothetical protein
MAKKIDPQNKKQFGAVTTMLAVSDIAAAVRFYQKAFGFSKRAVMNGPDGKPIHAELTLRGMALMLGSESAEWGKRSLKSPCASNQTTPHCELSKPASTPLLASQPPASTMGGRPLLWTDEPRQAAYRHQIPGPKSGVLRGSTQTVTDQAAQVESCQARIPDRPSSGRLNSEGFYGGRATSVWPHYQDI